MALTMMCGRYNHHQNNGVIKQFLYGNSAWDTVTMCLGKRLIHRKEVFLKMTLECVVSLKEGL